MYLFLLLSDILFCIDTSTGRPVIIPENIRKTIAFNEFKKLPALGKWFVIMVLARNSILLYSDEHNGLTECKIRQLKKLGYELILVRILTISLFFFSVIIRLL